MARQVDSHDDDLILQGCAQGLYARLFGSRGYDAIVVWLSHQPPAGLALKEPVRLNDSVIRRSGTRGVHGVCERFPICLRGPEFEPLAPANECLRLVENEVLQGLRVVRRAQFVHNLLDSV